MEKRDHGAGPVPSIERETTMEEYIGLDISLKDTTISVRRNGKRIWRGKCPSDPNLLAEVIRKRAPAAERVVFETGPLSVWFYHELTAQGVPAICIDAQLDRQLVAATRQSDACQVLMSIPGIGAVTSASFVATIEDPKNFRTSRSVGAWLGLTTRRYQSGEVDYDGHISRRGDSHPRGLLYEAATVILTRANADSSLRTWGMKLRERVGFKRAAVAVARKLSVIMHRMLTTGETFDRSAGMIA
jgi:transposase